MLSLLAAVLLASAPATPSLSLLPEDVPTHSARLLVAQAPEAGVQEVPVPSTPFPDRSLDARIQELTQRVGLLQEEIDGIRLGRPRSSKVMTTIGFILAAALLIGVPVMIDGLLDSGTDRTLKLFVGLPITAVGVVGVVLVVTGFSRGGRIARENKARREALVEEKTQLEAELRDLRARRDGLRSRQWQPRPSVPLIAVNF
ncbi:hypothetical protein COCOR_05916 [Corallococcus coralloides DSM 2259]|uniref:Uncharacterized protein n=1 Tax=Corallococcus coralloides (strain ATCC 25202 / DSM 2259 / NBRC 100086 / M2) TaxID=1144275 RepID=H8MIC8_CORCM|nr:hypothetical protein [Corallococcus coralloides]AFE06655.1 hypothetical protein COCOR_05916 [Corallococcus coralloides DSM 2259]